MSVFDGEQTTATTGNSKENRDDQDYLSVVVEEKGEQWSDPNVLAKGYKMSQEYIAELERQTQELKEDLGKQEHTKDLLDQLRNQREPSAGAGKPQEPTATTDEGNSTLAFSEDELKSLVTSTLSEMSAKEKAEANVKTVDDKLDEVYGEKAGDVVKRKAQELGMSMDRMKEIAAESPAAFLRLVDGGEPQKDGPSVPKSTINSSAETFNASQKRDFQHYQKLRRENPKEYYSSNVQQQMLKDRLEMGDSFYN